MNSPTPEQVLQERTNADLTQTEAAQVVHAVLGTWQQWEKGKRNMHPAFWELFLLKTAQARQQKKRQEKEEQVGKYDPWVAGWMLGKYQAYQPFPTESQLGEWLEGFKYGTTEVGEYHLWQQCLAEYVQGRDAPEYLLKFSTPIQGG